MRFRRIVQDESGQTTVEAAYLVPIVFVLILMLLQPMILFYNQALMKSAATEGCRLLLTRPAERGDEKYIGFVQRRLSAIPPVSVFHVHEPCSWDIKVTGNESSSEVSVEIENKIQPLPLIGNVWMYGKRADGKYVLQQTKVSLPGLGSKGVEE